MAPAPSAGGSALLRTDAEILAAGAAAVAGWAPLTDEQVRRVAVLLEPVMADDRWWRRLGRAAPPAG